MAKAKVNELQDKILYFGKSVEDSISVSLDLSEINGNSSCRYAYFVYIGSDREDGCYEFTDPKRATSNNVNITLYGQSDAIEYFPSSATSCDAFISLTNNDEQNILMSLFATEKALHYAKPPVGISCEFPQTTTANTI